MPDDPPGTSVSEAVPAPAELSVVAAPSQPASRLIPARDKMMRRGAKALTDTELLALVLSDFKGEASARLVRSKGLAALNGLAVAELRDISGCGLFQAQRLVAVFELHRRIHSTEYRERVRLVRPMDVAKQVDDIKRLRKEHLIGLYLDAQNGLIYRETLSIGTLNTTRTHPREILYPAITHCALAFVLAHNHPSGVPEPSSEDVEFTKAVQRAGEIVGIELYDHIVMAESGYVSLRERGCL